ncbi:MAG TPA: hypothetical protein VGO58_08030 [Chitinophagaceae bacterium]|nr:hypothetical protein [Chitinophagaceae bacterium]
MERQRPDNGVPLSVVFLFPTSKNEVFNILLNISIADVASGKNLFNSRIPFGIGAAVFPWPGKDAKFLGFTVFGSIGKIYKMKKSAYDDPHVVFPIANYAGYNLAVGAPLPEEVIKPYCDPKTTFALNAGFVFRLVY